MLLQLSRLLWERELKINAKIWFNAGLQAIFADCLSAELKYGLQVDCPLSSIILANHSSILAKAYKFRDLVFELSLTRLVAEPGPATHMIREPWLLSALVSTNSHPCWS